MLHAKKNTQRTVLIVVTYTEALPSELKTINNYLKSLKGAFAMNVIQYYTRKFSIILRMNNLQPLV